MSEKWKLCWDVISEYVLYLDRRCWGKPQSFLAAAVSGIAVTINMLCTSFGQLHISLET